MKFFTKKILKREDYDKGLVLLKELRDKSQKEKGCISYELYRDFDDEYTVIINEEWESLEDQKVHSKSEHFLRIVPAMKELCKENFDLVRYEEKIK
ncbi:putative quinol monooxygenase [Peptoniphilus raoultii]|uniref:putative quinol monooxygenase n=1 Tax=Peptoniphilus raoultii TaxID=1776387 RepID=UPI0008DAF0A0|nr:putative quinol monooxygenase [Peptoniphilus raoultii]